jgi:hypothetical protein
MVTRTPNELEQAADQVKATWSALAETVALLPGSGVRSPAQSIAMDAALVHARCLINFIAGNYAGKRISKDIQPKDFLGVDWWPGG